MKNPYAGLASLNEKHRETVAEICTLTAAVLTRLLTRLRPLSAALHGISVILYSVPFFEVHSILSCWWNFHFCKYVVDGVLSVYTSHRCMREICIEVHILVNIHNRTVLRCSTCCTPLLRSSPFLRATVVDTRERIFLLVLIFFKTARGEVSRCIGIPRFLIHVFFYFFKKITTNDSAARTSQSGTDSDSCMEDVHLFFLTGGGNGSFFKEIPENFHSFDLQKGRHPMERHFTLTEFVPVRSESSFHSCFKMEIQTPLSLPFSLSLSDFLSVRAHF